MTCDMIPEVPHVGGCQPSTSISAPAGTRAKPAQEAVTAPSEPHPQHQPGREGAVGVRVLTGVILRPESVGADCRPEDSPGQQPCLPEGVGPGQWTSLCESRTCGGTAPAGSLRCSSRDPGVTTGTPALCLLQAALRERGPRTAVFPGPGFPGVHGFPRRPDAAAAAPQFLPQSSRAEPSPARVWPPSQGLLGLMDKP